MTTNQDQAEFWSAQTDWVTQQNAMDSLLGPVLDGVLQVAALQPGERVLDIGCGTGASLLAVADKVGADGHVLGADISAPLLTLAAQRTAANPAIAVREADAQTADLGTGFDAVVSRFGVMFFEDTPAAFANLARALKPGGRFALGAWGDARENPYFMDAARAARTVLGEMPKTDRTLPGPFAFEQPARVADMFAKAGLRDVQITPTPCNLTPSGDLADFADLCLHVGPAAGALKYFEASDAQREELRRALMDIFAPCQTSNGVQVPALINYITARS